MASRNSIREAISDAVFHVYNRGVARQEIFVDSHDYRRFKLQLAESLAAEPTVSIWAYCLMPNHFHFLLHQEDGQGMANFMQRVGIAYAMYFNKRQNRVGPLYQGRYKAVRVVGPGHLMEESRYVHLNPQRAGLGWRQYQHSSIGVYLGERADPIADPLPVLELFDHPSDYQRYLSLGKIRS
jgi:REP element-mobilizing transposase RayT